MSTSITQSGSDGLPNSEDVIAGYDPNESEDEIGDDLPDADRIIQIHNRIENEYDLTHTGAAVAALRLNFRELLTQVDGYGGKYQRAAALLQKIITGHYFETGISGLAGWRLERIWMITDTSQRTEL